MNKSLMTIEKKWHQKSWFRAVVALLVLVVVLSAVALWLGFGLWQDIMNSSGEPLSDDLSGDLIPGANLMSPDKSPLRLSLEDLSRPYLGNPEAPLVIVEFSDFTCPFCLKAFPIMRELSVKYQDDLLYIYRQYPVVSENSLLYSQASLCANEQDKFWPMHDQLFINYGNVNLNNIATRIGLDLSQFQSCLAAEKYQSQIVADFQLGSDLGVAGTPTFFINGNKVAGVVTMAQWEQIIAKALELYEK